MSAESVTTAQKTKAVTAEAPARIDLAGGTLDLWPLSVIVEGARTINLAVDLKARAVIRPMSRGRVEIVSRDRKLRYETNVPLKAPQRGTRLSFVRRLVESFEPDRGFQLECSAAAPAGAGLGGSSTLGIAVGGALNEFLDRGLSRKALFRHVMRVETLELKVPTGWQDYLAALHGGMNCFQESSDGPRRQAIVPPQGFEKRWVLGYTGNPRDSGFSNWDMYRRFVDGEPATVKGLQRIAQIAARLEQALRRGDLNAVGRAIEAEGRQRVLLAPSVEPPALRKAATAARKAGALGVKICGAGGGGCLVAFAAEGRESSVAEAWTGQGVEVLPFKIARRGLVIRPGSEPQA